MPAADPNRSASRLTTVLVRIPHGRRDPLQPGEHAYNVHIKVPLRTADLHIESAGEARTDCHVGQRRTAVSRRSPRISVTPIGRSRRSLHCNLVGVADGCQSFLSE
jgi:hypothetical protein